MITAQKVRQATTFLLCFFSVASRKQATAQRNGESTSGEERSWQPLSNSAAADSIIVNPNIILLRFYFVVFIYLFLFFVVVVLSPVTYYREFDFQKTKNDTLLATYGDSTNRKAFATTKVPSS
eukprot:gene8272-5792_t